MAYIGQKFAVGSKIEEAGVYKPECTNKGADWELVEKTGTT